MAERLSLTLHFGRGSYCKKTTRCVCTVHNHFYYTQFFILHIVYTCFRVHWTGLWEHVATSAAGRMVIRCWWFLPYWQGDLLRLPVSLPVWWHLAFCCLFCMTPIDLSSIFVSCFTALIFFTVLIHFKCTYYCNLHLASISCCHAKCM